MKAVWARVRSDLQSHWRSSVALVLMIGIASAVVIASAAGARRTDTAYDRFRTETNGFDVGVLSCPTGGPWPETNLQEVANLPQVRDSLQAFMNAGYVSTASGRPLFFKDPNTDSAIVGPKDPADAGKIGAKILAGRLPNPNAPNEVTIGYRNPQDPAVKVGATIYAHLIRPDADPQKWASDANLGPELFGKPIPLKVVGITLISGPGIEIRGDSADVSGTPAFYRTYGSEGYECSALFGWLDNGMADAQAFTKGVQGIEPQAVEISAADEATFAHRNTHVQAVVLWVFAVAVALAGLMIFGQALARQTAIDAAENPILRALGMTRRQLFEVSLLRSMSIGVGAAAVAVGLSIAVSGFFPTGIARILEPNPGVAIDPLAVLGGALFIVLAVLLISALPAWRASRVRGDALGLSLIEEARRPSAIATAGSRAGLPAPAVTGMRLVLEPGRGRTAVPVRSAIIGLVIAIVALVSSVTFAASFDHLLTTPRLTGITFEAGAGNPYVPNMGPVVRPKLAADPGLANLAGGNFAQSVVASGPKGDVSVNIWGLDQIKGEQHPPVIDGNWPVSTGEIAMGSKTMRDAGVGIGDTVQVHGGGETEPLKVVGRVVFPDFGFGPGLGEGAGVTFDQLQKFFPDVDEDLYLFDFAAVGNEAAVVSRVNRVLAPFGANVQQTGQAQITTASLTPVKRTRALPTVLAGVLALMAIAMLAHTLLTSIRRRRRDLAILKTLGFTRGQVSASVAWQASTLVAVSLLIGVPLGIAVGRWAWNLFAGQLGVIPEAVVPIATVLLIVPLALILANVIGLLPGLSAGRTKPSIVLRAE